MEARGRHRRVVFGRPLTTDLSRISIELVGGDIVRCRARLGVPRVRMRCPVDSPNDNTGVLTRKYRWNYLSGDVDLDS